MKTRRMTAGYCLVFLRSVTYAVLLTGLGISAQTSTPGADIPDRVSQFADAKMTVSKLDWIMLVARVRIIEQASAHGGTHHTSLVTMSYDRDKKQVAIKSFVDPEWIGRARIDDVKTALLEESASYCVDGLGMAEAEAGEPLGALNLKADCRVDFHTWTTDKSGNVATKEIASWVGGQVILK